MDQLLIYINEVKEYVPLFVLLLRVGQVLHLILLDNPCSLKIIQPHLTQLAQTNLHCCVI